MKKQICNNKLKYTYVTREREWGGGQEKSGEERGGTKERESDRLSR